MSGPAISPRTRRYLSADALFALLRQRFETVQDPRKQSHLTFTLPDVLASGLAMFSLKDPSLLAYGERQDDPSLKNVFGIKSIPSDTQFREILDPIEADALNEAFADVFAELQRGGVLEQFR
ncbi:transposase family protein, partial [Rhodopirellula sp. MGV]|uniref:transposase family protein n=1 Tax=Rhodopirellula sp. MGV TaxID=2023130 RepID=UPI000BD110CC